MVTAFCIESQIFVMSSFTGVSVITGDECTMLPVYTDADSGYHLLVVKGYSRTLQEIPNGDEITSFDCFTVGGYNWFLNYYPNGYDPSCADYISLCLGLCEDQCIEHPVEVKCQFSFIDQVEYQKPMHIRATETRSFSGSDIYHGCDKFMKRDALERSTHLKHDGFIIRCDIMICKDRNSQDVSATTSDIGQHLDHLLQNKACANASVLSTFLARS